MEIDIIEVRVGNYFEQNRQIKEITSDDLKQVEQLLPQLKPLSITVQRLQRLNFVLERGQQGLIYQKLVYNILFTFVRLKGDRLQLIIHGTVKLPHIQYIHQLQNVCYDLSGDVLKRTVNPIQKVIISDKTLPNPFTPNKAISGKYRRRE